MMTSPALILGVPLFDTTANKILKDDLGPIVGGFRCNEFGHLCGNPAMPPSRYAPNGDANATVTYDECISNDRDGYLIGVADTAQRLRKLKDDRGQVIVAAITGPTTPYTVQWTSPHDDPSCGGTTCTTW